MFVSGNSEIHMESCIINNFEKQKEWSDEPLIYLQAISNSSFDNVQFIDTSIEHTIYARYAQLNITNCVFEHEESEENDQHNYLRFDDTEVTMNNNIFKNCNALSSNQNGAAIQSVGDSNITILNSNFENLQGTFGGAIHI
jgi:hypothetical protein